MEESEAKIGAALIIIGMLTGCYAVGGGLVAIAVGLEIGATWGFAVLAAVVVLLPLVAMLSAHLVPGELRVDLSDD